MNYYFYSFTIESKLASHENVCKYHNYCPMIMPKKDNIILKHNQDKKYLKTPLPSKTQNCWLKKYPLVILINNNLTQQKYANIQSVAIHYLHTVHLIVVEANKVFTEILNK